MKTLAVIPAKSKSIRIPNKNLVDLSGIPLIEWTLIASKGLFDDVLVVTDNPITAGLAKKYEAKVALHPDGDPGATAVVIDALESKGYKKFFDTVFMLQPTSPFRSAKSIRTALHEFRIVKDSEPLTLISIMDSGKRCTFMDIGTTFTGRHFLMPQYNDKPAESPNSYRVNGAIFGTTVDNLLNKKSFIKDTWSLPILMDGIESIEIDTPADLTLARAVAKGLLKK